MLVALTLLFSVSRALFAQTAGPSAGQPVPLEMSSSYASRFQDGHENVLLLRGNCEIQQGSQRWMAPTIVLWELPDSTAQRRHIVAYLEGTSEQPVTVIAPNEPQRSVPYHIVRLETSNNDSYRGRPIADVPQAINDPVYRRAQERRREFSQRIQQAQFTQPVPGGPLPFLPAPAPRLQRRVTISPRFLGEQLEAKAEESVGTIPPEYVITVTGGVNIVVENVPVQINGQTVLTSIDLTADRAVIWTQASQGANIADFELDENTPFQVYLEGNIIVRQGSSQVRASHAFYDVNQRRGLLMNAELRTLLPDYEGTLRLRAAEVRQYSETSFHAKNAFFTTSEFGQPKYRIEASDIFLEERFGPNPGRIDTLTGQPDNSTLWVTSLNNRIFLENIPIFAAPYLSGPAEDPQIPLRKLEVGYSGIFGFDVESEWDISGLFGTQLPQGIDWLIEADYLSQRGPAVGTKSEFSFDSALFGMPVHNEGLGHLYYINDHGEDNLGLGRRDLPPPDENRGRILWRDRTTFSPNTWVITEVGHIFNNDRNFLEQYFESEFDRGKDLENLAMLNHQVDNLTASLLISGRSNDFENQTNWLPRADLTLLGEPLFGSPVMWSQHSSIGYGQVRPAEAPPDPVADPFLPLYYYTDVQGLVAMSRHELSLPMTLGPVNWAPYVLGEVAHWQEDLTGDDLTRWYGSAGVRGSIQFAKYMPHVRSRILGLNGLAHKVTIDADYHFAESSADLSIVPQYNEFDENAQERFRERFLGIEFGGVLPPMFDPRNYALRSGAGHSVTAPYHELVDDQHVVWLGMRNRWQTKVGPPEAPRIVDWMELDLGTAIFPNADRDNFGETLGLLTGRYAWHVGPRTSLIANGVFDVFDMGQQVWNVGILNQRTNRGSLYVGFRDVDIGPIDSQLITTSFSYVMSPNLYVATFGASFDVAEGTDRGESLTITRIGEYFLLHFGLGYDRSRDNVGVALSFEPKFGSYGSDSMQLNSLLGIP